MFELPRPEVETEEGHHCYALGLAEGKWASGEQIVVCLYVNCSTEFGNHYLNYHHDDGSYFGFHSIEFDSNNIAPALIHLWYGNQIMPHDWVLHPCKGPNAQESPGLAARFQSLKNQFCKIVVDAKLHSDTSDPSEQIMVGRRNGILRSRFLIEAFEEMEKIYLQDP